MADMRISEDFIIGQASLVNEIEDQRDAFNDALKSAWSDYREELKLLGLTGKEIAAEVAALKSAISDTRMTAEDRAKAEEKADGKDGYLAILSGPRARARIREAKSEPLPPKAAGQGLAEPALMLGSSQPANIKSAPITEQQDASHPASDLTASPKLPQGQVAPIQESPRKAAEAEGESPASMVDASASAEAGIDGQPSLTPATSDRTITTNVSGRMAGVTGGESAATLSFADKIKLLRPNCQHPEACRSSGGKAHCGPCGRAAETGSAA